MPFFSARLLPPANKQEKERFYQILHFHISLLIGIFLQPPSFRHNTKNKNVVPFLFRNKFFFFNISSS